MSGLAGTVAQGMAFGTGSAIAHRAIGAVAGAVSSDGDGDVANTSGNSQPNNGATEPQPCTLEAQQFYQCLDTNLNNISACQQFMDAIAQCRHDEETRQQYS